MSLRGGHLVEDAVALANRPRREPERAAATRTVASERSVSDRVADDTARDAGRSHGGDFAVARHAAEPQQHSDQNPNGTVKVRASGKVSENRYATVCGGAELRTRIAKSWLALRRNRTKVNSTPPSRAPTAISRNTALLRIRMGHHTGSGHHPGKLQSLPTPQSPTSVRSWPGAAEVERVEVWTNRPERDPSPFHRTAARAQPPK